MKKKVQNNVIFKALHQLNGLNYSEVLSYIKSVKKQFDILDGRALAFFEKSDKQALTAKFSPNQSAYTDKEPLQESIFLYFDISTSIELLTYIVYLRSIIDECIGANNIRFSDLRLQHSTAFIDLLGDDLRVNEQLLNRVKHQYEPTIKSFQPFNLTIVGPHIFDTGGIVLEGIVYSKQFYELRESAAQKNSHVPNGVQRGIHNIIHSTIGYITKATPKQLMKLCWTFESMRKEAVNIPVRIRDSRIIPTRNKGLVGQPIIMPFQGVRSKSLHEKDICSIFQKLLNLTPQWSNKNELKDFVWEEALYWIESNHTPDRESPLPRRRPSRRRFLRRRCLLDILAATVAGYG